MEGNYPPVAMIELSAKPELTYGLVVGIEKYLETAWSVPGGGPADDAIKFAQWLSARGVPRDNIRLCLSPLEDIEHSELTIEEATEHKIADLITGWLSEKKGDLLYLFWAGHGLITSTRNRRLLCADSTKQNWQNLDLNSLLIYLSSDSFKIKHHICIIDACANYILESNGREEDDYLPKNSHNNLSASSEIPVLAKEIKELEPTDIETLADILKRSGRVSKINSRRALCISIQLDPSDIDFIENSSARDFATQLVSQLYESRNFPALSKLCETITPSVPGFKSELNFIQKKINCN
ncbi:MAG: caspase family protein [Coleofasciculus sp. D1-CHI-01]|uniref:hypothetical protein n=1 Tax=Coleofasciculus sp. D1-CHI-01 TaxID=3068482 RepID=UPI0032F86169